LSVSSGRFLALSQRDLAKAAAFLFPDQQFRAKALFVLHIAADAKKPASS